MNRGVRDVAELETGLTPDEARAAWRHLLDEGLIRRFNLAYAAILSPEGMQAIESGLPLADPPPAPPAKVVIVRGSGTAAREAVAQFVTDIELEAILLSDPVVNGRTMMEQTEEHGDVGFAIILLTRQDLPYPRMEVLMEIGYFMGRLGRARVCALAIDSTRTLPPDLGGVALYALDASENWKSVLTLALKPSGI